MRQGANRVTTQTLQDAPYHTKIDATVLYQPLSFGFGATQITIINDSEHTCYFSFDGVTAHGEILAGEPFNMTASGQTEIYIRVDDATGTNYIRVWAY